MDLSAKCCFCSCQFDKSTQALLRSLQWREREKIKENCLEKVLTIQTKFEPQHIEDIRRLEISLQVLYM